MNNLFKILLITTSLIVAVNEAHAHDHILTDQSGMTLYTFDNDTKGKSNCYDSCATSWPPYLVKDSHAYNGKWSVITRKDGSKQWAFAGQALYTWVGDQKAGDKTGDGIGGVWHIAKKDSSTSSKKTQEKGSLLGY